MEKTQSLTTARMKGLVDVSRLKMFAFANLPKSSILRDLLLAEPDELPTTDFLVKIGLWLKILRRELAR